MFRIATATLIAFVAVSLASTTPVGADVIQLDNGDTIHGRLIQVTEKQLKLHHEILGEVDIPRARVHAIVLGDPKTGKVVKPDGTEPEQETPKDVIDRLVNKDFDPKAVEKMQKGAKRQPTPEDVVEQLRREGVDPALKDRLHLMLPGFGAPEVQDYFNGSVQGLMNGSITIQNIRDDAIDARDQLHALMEDLGPDAAALKGYYGILDNFIKKTAPKEPREKQQSPSPNRQNGRR